MMKKTIVLLGRSIREMDLGKNYHHITKYGFKKPWGALVKDYGYYKTYIRGGEMWHVPKKNTKLMWDNER